jgi:syntaxin 1B/2/3
MLSNKSDKHTSQVSYVLPCPSLYPFPSRLPPSHPQSRLDTTPNSAAARETDELVASTRALTAANKNAIQKLNKLAKDKAQKQQVQAGKSRFMGLLQEYQTVEKEFRKKVKERGERQYKIG